MEYAATTLPRRRPLTSALHVNAREVGAWTVGFAPVLYLALRGGGYDLVIRSEVGLAVWWIVLLGVLAGVLPLGRIGRLGWAAMALLAGFAIWTGIATSWSESAERTVIELGRVATYLGFLVLGLCVLRRETMRHLVMGMAVAFGVVSVLAVLSRLFPGAFPANQVVAFFPGSTERLNYPLNYADGTGNFLAMGIPLLAVTATRGRTLVAQAVAAATIPVAVLGIVLTASRGSILTAIVGIVFFYLLTPDRLPKLLTGLAAAAGSAILVGSLLHRSALRNGLSTPLAVSQRHQLTVLLLVTCVGVALIQVGIGLAARYAIRPPELRFSRRRTSYAALATLAVAVVIAIAAGLPGYLSHQWSLFKRTDTTGAAATSTNVYTRLTTVAGSHRYQYWNTAFHAFKSKPMTGIGPGTFEFYWAQHGPFYEFIRNAHSLYIETLAEAGIPGFVLIVGLLATILVGGLIRCMRAPPLARVSMAGATAAFAAFCAAAGYDWMWQLPAAPVAALLLGSALLALPGVRQREPLRSWRTWVPRLGISAAAVAAVVAIAIPFGATAAIRSSQSEVQKGHLQAALDDAATAQQLEPYAATPRLQRALILEQEHDLGGARVAIHQALAREPTDWRIWLIDSRIQAESGNTGAAVRDFRFAHALNPLSPTTAING